MRLMINDILVHLVNSDTKSYLRRTYSDKKLKIKFVHRDLTIIDTR